MIITQEYLKSLKPCADRWENYLEHYSEWSGTFHEFLGLPELTHDDKFWVFVRTVDENKKRLFAADCAESVLHLFEKRYPNDSRPRKAIEAARATADAAAYDAAAANAAAAAAYDAAAANAAAAAAFAAAYAAARATAARATAARAAAARATAARKSEELKQIEFMKRYA